MATRAVVHGIVSALVLVALVAPDPARAGIWETRAPLLEPNSETAVAELGGKIYVLGGYPANRITVSTVQVYDAESDSWTLTTPLPQGVNHGMAAAVDGKVYIIGGQTSANGGGPFVNSVYAFDPDDATWTPRAPMPTSRSGGAAGVIGGKIYVAGGRPPHGQDFAVYDPVADAWQTLPNMPSQRNHVGAGVIDGKFYVVAGRLGAGFTSEQTAVLEVYDPVTNTWTTREPIPTARSGMNAMVAYGCLHTFGGESAAGIFAAHEAYSPLSDSWQNLEPLPIAVHGVTGAALIDDWIHLPGGGTGSGGSSGSTIHQVYRPSIGCMATVQVLEVGVLATVAGEAEVSAVVPPAPVGSTWDVELLRVDILHNGHDLRTAPGTTPAEQLQNSLCSLGGAGTFAPGAIVSVTDATTVLVSGEVVGYLLIATDSTSGSRAPAGIGRRGVAVCAP